MSDLKAELAVHDTSALCGLWTTLEARLALSPPVQRENNPNPSRSSPIPGASLESALSPGLTASATHYPNPSFREAIESHDVSEPFSPTDALLSSWTATRTKG